MEKLETNNLFASRDTVREAMQYLDDIMKTVHDGGDRMAAYTGAYVLYNTVVQHYEDLGVYETLGRKSYDQDNLEEVYHGC